MSLPAEPIGSIPRPDPLIEAVATYGSEDPRVAPLYQEAVRDTVREFERTGSPVISDGEQRKYPNFWDYPVQGLINTAPDGLRIPFAAGHIRRMPRLVRGPFSYRRYADGFLAEALRHSRVPVKQALISPSALSLMYPAEGIPGYSRDEFIHDLIRAHCDDTSTTRAMAFAKISARVEGTSLAAAELRIA
jgi:5-methyltetrahydropteroyltriglutamate--homocysteine methyltransferase